MGTTSGKIRKLKYFITSPAPLHPASGLYPDYKIEKFAICTLITAKSGPQAQNRDLYMGFGTTSSGIFGGSILISSQHDL